MVENRGPLLRAVCLTMVSLAFVPMVLRVYVRVRVIRSFGWDDALMVGAMLSHIMFATCAVAGTVYGTGRHFKDLSDEGIFMAMRYWWLCYIAYCITMICAKMSIGVFLLRITVNSVHRWIVYIVMGLTVLTGLVFFFVTLFQCSPISYFWNKKLENGTCVNVDIIIALTFLYSGINAIVDFTFGILPMWLVWNLNMRKSEKLALIPILGMACIASSAVVVRMAYVMDFRGNDFLYDTVDIAIWSDVEQGLAIAAGSLATLRPLWREISTRLGFSLPSTRPFKDSGRETPFQDSGFNSGRGKAKRSGPFSLMTFTRNENEEETKWDGARPVKLRDDIPGDDESTGGGDGKGFTTWRIQVGDGSEEELSGAGGITRQTDVYMHSEADKRRKN
ncbi:hypothetical protein BU24DRAFT_131223 [Aaosphaeria arxii CBS 175.79]|uniref:Rhodopsin domain-containing protein n=1 Tax=Aaosphaeria arxii CBS 175.79 TaxID=1450172 RepID=A0A6A5Y633_9PLEO|nr:uncharacterized protein BU24DRAFT_131223 [Aaosphaeria arxii CBS 175.79]KAF2020014.1 hypothetical protein BU24DRAFT_131223 [Aaosphaeria arxii CBS 175.79]